MQLYPLSTGLTRVVGRLINTEDLTLFVHSGKDFNSYLPRAQHTVVSKAFNIMRLSSSSWASILEHKSY